MVDFALLPPEINSVRIYAGAGSAPLVAAATAWDSLAVELNSAATAYRSVLSTLTGGPWVGPSSSAMAAAAAPYVFWMDTTAAQAKQTASRLGAALGAYEAAFAATVPPPAVEVNRALLASLVATNIFGQNTPAIAATEAQYAEMWAQDAAAMYDYAGASVSATTLTPFGPPPQIATLIATNTQGAAVAQATASAADSSIQTTLSQLLSAIPGALRNLASAGMFNPITWLENILGSPTGTALNVLAANVGNLNLVSSGFAYSVSAGLTLASTLGGFVPSADAVAEVAPEVGLASVVDSSALATPGTTGVTAGMGASATVGKLSVPAPWVSAPAIRLAATASPSAGLTGLTLAGAAGPSSCSGDIPVMGSLVNAPRGDQTRPRSTSAHRVIASMPGEQGAGAQSPGREVPAQRSAAHVSTLSESERQELARLREKIAEVATERDAAARLLKEAML